MMNRIFVPTVLFLLLPLAGCSVAAAPAPHHDPARPYRAMALLSDRTFSLSGDQFLKQQAVLEATVRDEVTYNDVVWLVSIQALPEPVQEFAMPAHPLTRAARPEAEAELNRVKQRLIAAVRNTARAPGATDLKTPIETALNILRSHPQATSRLLVVGSDFLEDNGKGVIQHPPVLQGTSNAKEAISALLLVAWPKPEYLRNLQISQSELLSGVESEWTAMLKKGNVSRVTVMPLDAVPAAGNSAAAPL